MLHGDNVRRPGINRVIVSIAVNIYIRRTNRTLGKGFIGIGFPVALGIGQTKTGTECIVHKTVGHNAGILAAEFFRTIIVKLAR